jgi:hypothetical protein
MAEDLRSSRVERFLNGLQATGDSSKGDKVMMSARVQAGLTTIAIALAGTVMTYAAVTFTSTFKSLDAGAVSFAGKKVAALVMSNDDSLRVAGEESLVRELNARGMQAVASYRIAPKEELGRPETAKPWFERANVEGIMVVRPVSADTRQTYSSGTWVSTNYATLWNYYGYGWAAVYVPGGVQKETSVVVETTIFSVPRNELLWAAVSETRNPRDLRGFVEELVKESVKEMQKQGLAKRQLR